MQGGVLVKFQAPILRLSEKDCVPFLTGFSGVSASNLHVHIGVVAVGLEDGRGESVVVVIVAELSRGLNELLLLLHFPPLLLSRQVVGGGSLSAAVFHRKTSTRLRRLFVGRRLVVEPVQTGVADGLVRRGGDPVWRGLFWHIAHGRIDQGN